MTVQVCEAVVPCIGSLSPARGGTGVRGHGGMRDGCEPHEAVNDQKNRSEIK